MPKTKQKVHTHTRTHPPWSLLCIGQLLLGKGLTRHWRKPIFLFPAGINYK